MKAKLCWKRKAESTRSWLGNPSRVGNPGLSRLGNLKCTLLSQQLQPRSQLGKVSVTRNAPCRVGTNTKRLRTFSYSFGHNSSYWTRIQVIQKAMESQLRELQLLWRHKDKIHLYKLTKIPLKWVLMSKTRLKLKSTLKIFYKPIKHRQFIHQHIIHIHS